MPEENREDMQRPEQEREAPQPAALIENKSDAPRSRRLINLGNRNLIGKIPLKLLDWIILLMSLFILGTFAYFILQR